MSFLPPFALGVREEVFWFSVITMLSGNLGTIHWPEPLTARSREESTIRNPCGPPSQACSILPGRGGTWPPIVHSPGRLVQA